MLAQISRRVISKSLRFNSHVGAARLFSSLPYHLVVGMPALSPTMETGTISEWKVKEGDSFSAGDSLAEIETDKASIDFEAQDDGIVAKILVDAGSADIVVGVPIVVTVEEEEDVAAFKDFVPEAVEEPAAAPPVEPEPAPVAVAVAAPEPVVEVAPPAPVVVAPVPVIEVAAEAPMDVVASTVGPSWGNFARVKSPLAGVLSSEQAAYVEKYGSTGQVPI